MSLDYKTGVLDPFSMLGMDRAAERIAGAIRDNESIAVYGDFDTDGVTAVTLLTQAILAMGGDIRPYIPHRLREGYGLNVIDPDRIPEFRDFLVNVLDLRVSTADAVVDREFGEESDQSESDQSISTMTSLRRRNQGVKGAL